MTEFFQKSENINELADALAKAQAEIEDAELDSENPHFENKYASVASVLKAIRTSFSKQGLSISQLPSSQGTSHFLTTALIHKSGQFISSTMELLIGRKDMQGMGSALTYAKRQMAQAIAGISADEDDDGNGSVAPSQKTSKAQKEKAEPTLSKEEIEKLSRNPGEYVIKIGDFKGQQLKDIDPQQLNDYLLSLQASEKKGKKAPPIWKELMEFIGIYLKTLQEKSA